MAAVAFAGALVASGCGEEQPDLANGKLLFTGEGRCGTCHVLERAGTGGIIGPNLDEAFDQARSDGLGRKTIMEVVRVQIQETRRGSKMPEDLVTGDDVRDVAAYVASAAAVPGEDPGGLARSGRPLPGDAPEGKRIFNAAGCGSCHALADVGTAGNTGPRLDDLRAAARTRKPELSSEQYVKESIVAPNALIVAGFPRGLMPAYGDRLTEAEVDALVEYLLGLSR